MENKKSPLLLQQNRVWRIYQGGKLLDEFCGNPVQEDGLFPEDWLGSVVEANNLPREDTPPHEGLCKTDDGRYLKDCIAAAPEDMLGAAHVQALGNNLGVLVKFLDAAVRLPIQVHPDKKKAMEYFQSAYGKTEAWYILGGRDVNGEAPHIFMGFRDGVTGDEWRRCFEEQDIPAMSACLHKIDVHPGEVFLVRGGMPHAIGAGCFLLEIQEPTDYTISVEKTAPDGNPVPDFLCHQGIGFEKMFDCFHYDTADLRQLLDDVNLQPRNLKNEVGYSLDSLITSAHTTAFSLNRITVREKYSYPVDGRAAILAVISGAGLMRQGEKTWPLARGKSLFMPAATQDVRFEATGDGPLTLLECLPPALN